MNEMSQTPHSPPWNTTVKVVVIVFGVVLVVATLLRFQEIIPSMIIAVLIAYVITPVVDFVNERTRISRGLVTAAIYLVFFAAVALAISWLAPLLVRQTLSVKLDLERIGTSVETFLAQPLQIGGFSIDLAPVYDDVIATLTELVQVVAARSMTLVAGGEALDSGVDRIMEALAPGRFIFNLGHGIVPQTPIEHVGRLVRRVKGWSG